MFLFFQSLDDAQNEHKKKTTGEVSPQFCAGFRVSGRSSSAAAVW